MDDRPTICEDGDAMEISSGKEGPVVDVGRSPEEPYEGMEFESEEAAKLFYNAYAIHTGFIVRGCGIRRSKQDGSIIGRRLVCNKEGFGRSRAHGPSNRRPRVSNREGCKAEIVVKKEETGKWVVSKFVKEHSHSLKISSATQRQRRYIPLSRTPDEKDVKIRKLSAELQRERKRSAAYLEQLKMVLRDMEEHSSQLSRNIDNILQSVREVESKRTVSKT